jgi:5-methylcytosine-specific restriction endonuclease McrA
VGASLPRSWGARALVLNKHWVPISTTTARRAVTLLCRERASAICPHSYEVFDLDRWLDRSWERVHDDRAPCAADPAGEVVDRFLHTPTRPLEIPEVILLRRFGGAPRNEVSFSRRNLYRRDGHSCQYCGQRRPSSDLSIDHVVPRSRGGKTSWENCVLACVGCNTRKANKSLRESGLRLRSRPRKPSWSPLLETQPQARPESWLRFVREGPKAG